MLTFSNVLLLVYLQYFLFVNCLIPNLSVRKIDKKLIERKRHDTLEMCKIFNTESARLKQFDGAINKIDNRKYARKTRAKRDVDNVKLDNPEMNADDTKLVENIVDKLYNDVEENGEPVTYRQKYLNALSTVKVERNKTARRHNFAPAELLGPLSTTATPNYTMDQGHSGVKWPKRWKHAIVPYFIDSKTYDTHLSDIIIKAFDYLERATCIRLQRLRERPTDKESLQKVEWLYITNPSGIRQCVHSNEHKINKGVQMVVFGYDCLSLGEILHEIMHVLGFSHEHTRPDRDQFVTIFWDNIKPGYKKYFEIRSDDILINIPYDYASVLHYPPRAFSKNGQVTILAEPRVKIGQRDGLSEMDVEKISMIYGTECVDRNRQYLLKTCPSVVRAKVEQKNITQKEIEDYFKDRLWPFGIVNYKIRDKLEFSAEERENINAVIRHIEKETCIEFRDLTSYKDDEADQEIVDSETENSTNDTIEYGNKNQTDQYNTDNIIKPGNKMSLFFNSDENRVQQTEKSDDFTSSIDRPKGYVDSSYNFNEPDEVKIKGNVQRRMRRAAELPTSPSRRHADNILVLTRSPEPGCRCPSAGRPGGDKVLQINTDCFNSVNDLLHLFVHVLGLDHQHNMHDRDSYLQILWDNLTPEIRSEMQQKLPPAASVGFSYDYQSVMHYPWLQIKDGVTNIMYPIWNDGWAMGHWQGLSSTDVQKLNLLYFVQCQERKKHAATDNNRLYKQH